MSLLNLSRWNFRLADTVAAAEDTYCYHGIYYGSLLSEEDLSILRYVPRLERLSPASGPLADADRNFD